MPDLSDLVPFYSGQVENFNLLVLGQVQNFYKVFYILINYYEFTCCIENSVDSWLLQKPADLDLHCLQES